MGPFAALADQHQRLLELSNALTGAAGDPSGTPKERRRLAQQLVIEGSKHEAVEEEFVWPLVRDILEGGPSLAFAGIEQETGARKLLHELNRVKPANSHFMTLAFTTASHIRAHITYEESQVWPKLCLEASPDALERMAADVREAMPHAPTRPHPHVPPDAELLRSIAPISGALDRALDLVTGRGR